MTEVSNNESHEPTSANNNTLPNNTEMIAVGSATASYQPNDPWHHLPLDQVLPKVRLEVDHLDTGLTSEEAAERLRTLGGNVIPMQGGPNIFKMLLGHFFNAITIILGIVAVISAVFKDWGEFGVVVFVIVFNGLLGFYQEYSAEKSLQSLKEMTAGVATVLRDGNTHIVEIDQVVVSDIVILDQGALVPADLRLFDCSALEIDECLLTGESLPVTKFTHEVAPHPDGTALALGDRKNMAYRNTTVVHGRGKGVVVAGGVHTQMGMLAESLQSTQGADNKTPLQHKMERLMYALFGVCGILAVIVFAANDFEWRESTLIYASAVAIAILPESLIAVITVAMTISVRRMAKQKCIVRKLAALEVLGGVTDICSDKTGTLTENKMTVKWICVGTEFPYTVAGAPNAVYGVFLEKDEGSAEGEKNANINAASCADARKDIVAYFQCASLCGTTRLQRSETDRDVLVGAGNPTEIALQVVSWKSGMNPAYFTGQGWSLRSEYAFDSTAKKMTTVYEKEGQVYSATKGALERVLPLCEWRMVADGSLVPLTEEDRTTIAALVAAQADNGLRTLCLAQRNINEHPLPEPEEGQSEVPRELVEQHLIYVGVVAIYDPPRPESLPSVRTCQRAGIKVRMLTGDHVSTASAIAKDLHILNRTNNSATVLGGPDFDALDDGSIDVMTDLPSVVGRCSPQSKVKMIEALHRRGRVVAMTGDGFNDSPSIKIADIGCAMGSGTDVTKGVADLVITDDNFATIVKAVAEGRRISAGIKKFVVHLLSGNVAEVIVLVLGLPIKWGGMSVFILSPIEILWLNMFTGSPPATGLSLDEADDDILYQPPNTSGFFTWELNLDTLFYGIFLGACSLCSFVYVVYGYHGGLSGTDCNSPNGIGCDVIWTARSTAFTVLYIGLLLHAYNVRSTRRSIFQIKWFDNVWLWGSVAFGMVTLVPILYVEPIARNVFVHQMLTWEWIVVAVALTIFMILAEIYKIIKNLLFPLSKVEAPEVEVASATSSPRSPHDKPEPKFLVSSHANDERDIEEIAHQGVEEGNQTREQHLPPVTPFSATTSFAASFAGARTIRTPQSTKTKPQ